MMWKPPAAQNVPHLGRAFTDTQELKQVAAGTDIVKASLRAFVPQSMATIMLVDLVSYDAFPALAALEEVSSGNRVMCGSVMLNGDPGTLQHRVANALYDSCRSGSGVCPNFPNFDPVIGALRESPVVDSNVNYKVCVAKQSKLLVLQSLARRWTEYEASKEEAVKLIQEHNKHFNPDGDFMENDERPAANPDADRAVKRIKLSDLKTCTEADISSLQKPRKFNINGAAELITDESGESLYLVARSRNQFLTNREMFSFGSGEWRNGAEANEITSDAEGRWFSFNVSMKTVVIMERKTLPSHLQSLPFVDNPVELATVIRELEDAGEVKLAISHHSMNAAHDEISVDKPLVFVVEPPKDTEDDETQKKKKKKKNKQSKPAVNMNTFGNGLSISKFKTNTHFTIGFRCRLDAAGENGLKTLTPIRPVACVAGSLDVAESIIKLM